MKRKISLENTEEIISTENIEETQTETIQTTEELTLLTNIHNDLGFICCFLIFFTLVIILKYAYKFFNMIFTF